MPPSKPCAILISLLKIKLVFYIFYTYHNPMREISLIKHIRANEIWIFLLILIAANAVFVSAVVQGHLPSGVYGHGRFILLASILFALVFWLRGISGVWQVLRPMFEWRRSLGLYLFAFFWTIALCTIVLFAKGIFTGDSLQLSDLTPGLQSFSHLGLLKTLFISSFIGEVVWISYALRQLSRRYTYYVSALIVGFFWTLWWLPMAVHNFGIIPNLPLPALFINQSGIAIMCAFVYFHTRSGLLVLLMQIAFNATILVFPVTPDQGGPGTYWAFAITYFVCATLLVLRFGPHPLVHCEIRATGSPDPSKISSVSVVEHR